MQRSFFLFKQKTAYEMRISDWSSDVCSSDLVHAARLDGQALGLRRTLNLPGISVRVSEMLDSLARVGGEAARAPTGRASRRERVCQYVSISVVAVSFTTTQSNAANNNRSLRNRPCLARARPN